MKRKTKIIQVPMSKELLQRLDEASRGRGESRAAIIREACAQYIASAEKAELVRRYIEGYERFPEPAEEPDWRERLAAEVWGEEDWDQEEWARKGEQELSDRLAEDE
jgi:metal-responsive CopG/Arc/MetJ family transcriptional regulator